MPEPSKVVPIQIETDHSGDSSPVVYFAISDVQVGGPDQESWHDVAQDDSVPTIEKAGASLDRAVATVRPVVARILERLSAVGDGRPEEIEITLGVKLSAKVGFFVAESQGEGSIGLKLKYRLGS
jgi:hypothetical protein